jgi:biotin operon repressor
VWSPDHLFADIAPFLWPFVLLSLGVALTPVSPISWSYSTWLLFIIPLIITVFAPIRTFSGPLRFAYLEYASKIASLAVFLLKAVVINFHSIPTLALPALFFLPVLPVLFFVFFPALPVAWHYIAYHYRRRLEAVTTSVAETNASLDLGIARARQAIALAHSYEKQALYTVSTTGSIPLLALPRHSIDFATPEFNRSEGHWRLIQTPGTLGADLAGKVLDTEKQMAEIEDASQGVRALSEQAVAVATEGEMVAGEELAENAAHSLETVLKQVDELRSKADQARSIWVDFRRRLKAVTISVAETTASLDLALASARQAMTLAHTYEKEALYTVSTTGTIPLLALPRHSTDFATPEFNRSKGHWRLIQTPGTLGADLAGKVLDTEKQMAEIEDASQGVRALSEQAVAVATEGGMAAGEKSATNAAHSLETVLKQVDELRSKADQARSIWVEFRRRLKAVTTSVAETTASLDLAIVGARQAMTLAHTYEKEALYTISTTGSTPMLALPRHSTDFATPEFNRSEGHWRLIQTPGTLGADLAGKVLDTEKQMAIIEDASREVRALSEQAVADATDGDMVTGEELAENATQSLENVVKQVDELRSISDQARSTWVEFRRRLKAVTTSVAETTASLDIAIASARQAMTLAHTYEKEALYTVSTTGSTPMLALPWHSTDFATPEFNRSEGHWRLIQTPGTLGADLAGKALGTEKQMAAIEDASKGVCALSEQAVAVATGGDMVEGEKLAGNAAHSLETVLTQVGELRLIADQARCIWVEFRRRLKSVTTSVAETNASLDFAIARARKAITLAHSYEKQALYTVSTTGTTSLLAFSRQSTDFARPEFNQSEGHWRLIQTPGTLGADLAGKVLDTEKQMAVIEDTSRGVRALLEQAVAVATEGDMVAGEKLAKKAVQWLEKAVKQVDELGSKADQARCTWVEFRLRLNKVSTSASATAASLDLAVTQAQRAAHLAHTYEKQALVFISTTRRTASQTLALHGADFFGTTAPVQKARQTISHEANRARTLGSSLTTKMSSVEGNIGDVESRAEKIRALLEQAVTATVDGDVARGETLTASAADSLKAVVESVRGLCSTSDNVRQAWVELSVEASTIP